MTDAQIVGFDGSEDALHALRWAAARTDLLGRLQPVMAWQYPWWAFVPSAVGQVAPPSEKDFAAAVEKSALKALDQLDAKHSAEPLVIHGSPGPSLVAAAEQGTLLVVGCRGRGAIASGVLGSTSSHCARHSQKPVIVVPEGTPFEDEHGRVVVGIDGSEASMTALEWALDHTPTSSRIDVIHAWQNDAVATGVAALADARLAELSTTLVEEAVGRVRQRAEESGRVIEGHSRHGDARQVLHDEGASADLVVVGAQGHSGIVQLLLGSTASALVHQPQTATAVVR